MRNTNDWSIIEKYNKQDGEFFYFVNYRGKDKKKFSNDKRYIMKTLSNQKDFERRSRMLREISNLRSLNNPGIAKVFDTNVELFEDVSNKLFFVTEFIEGYSLKDLIKDHNISFDDKIKSFIQLINIMSYCHENGVYHQHLLPNNIICRNDIVTDLVLIDYGLSFNIATNEGMPRVLKNMDQQFLSLPELGKYQNFQKHDPRSDITLCCGILFYMLTELNPLYLLDHYLLKPHQRASSRIKLKEVSGTHFDKLNRIFDIAFNIDIDKRFQSFQALLLELQDDHYDVETDTDDHILDSMYDKDNNIVKFEAQNDNSSISVLMELSSNIDMIMKYVARKLRGYTTVHLCDRAIDYPNYSLHHTYEFINIDHFEDTSSVVVNTMLEKSEIILYINDPISRKEIVRMPIADCKQYFKIASLKLKRHFDKRLHRQYNISEAFA